MKYHNYRLYIILLLALGLRLYFAFTASAVPDYSDMALYNKLAAGSGIPTSLPPAYPLFLRLIYAVFGAYNYTAVFVIQALLSVCTVWLIYYVTRKIESENAGLVAAAIAAVYPNFIAYNLTTMTEAVTLLLVMLLLASLVVETDERRRSIFAAVTICIGFYLRPIFLFFIPGVFPFTRKRLWFIGVIVMLLAPWFIYGVFSDGSSSRGARMFYKSYNERSDGISNYDLSESKLGNTDISSSTYVREALDFIRNNGWDTVNIIYNKFALILCRGYDQFVLKDIAGGNKYILYLFYYLHIPIFLLGAILMIRFYDRKLGVLILPSASYLLVTILLAFFKIRYRLPIEPMFVIASAILVTSIAGSGKFRIRQPESVTRGSRKKDRKSRGKKRQGKQAVRPSATQAKVASTVESGTGLTIGELLSQVCTDVRGHWKVLLGLLIAALSLRILFAVFLGIVPAREETLHIVRLALEGGIGPSDPPIYPLLIRTVLSIAGNSQLVPLYVVQGLIGVATVLLFFTVTIRLFDTATAVITTGIAAIYMNFLVYGATIAPGFFGIFMFVLLTAVAVSGLGGLYKSAACGLIVGFGTMIQPHFLFLVPGLLLVLDKRKIFLAALALTLLPLSVRNSIVHGSFVPVYSASLFGLGAGSSSVSGDNLAIIDKLYNNVAILFSRGWDKQQRVDLAGIIYVARYGYVILMTTGLAGLIRHYRREQSGLLLPILGYFLVLVLFSRFLFQHRPLIEPVLVFYSGLLLAGGIAFSYRWFGEIQVQEKISRPIRSGREDCPWFQRNNTYISRTKRVVDPSAARIHIRLSFRRRERTRMKIAYIGLDLPEGKVRFEDPVVHSLTAKFSPKKVTPYYFELVTSDFEAADMIVVARDRVLDVLIYDIEKLETRLERSDDEEERAAIAVTLAELENEVPVCDMDLDDSATAYMRQIGPLSLKPVLIVDSDSVNVQELLPFVLEKSGMMFFYTAGEQEVHAWLISRGFDAQECAGRIHTDLARGFVKAEIVSVDDLLQCHSMADARKRGFSRLVDRDFVIPSDTVLEIRFNI